MIYKPEYLESHCAAPLVQSPPFNFDGVTMRVLPLRAIQRRLQQLCDSYLNLVPPEVAYFRPAVPFVYLAIINYGKMSSDAAIKLGWVAQNEVTFSLLLEQYRKEKDGWVFVDWATVSPYIFVDSEMSLTTGREVYGWPKARAWLDPGINRWTVNPRSGQWLMSLSTLTFPRLYGGQKPVPRVLLEIDSEPAPAFLEWPFDPLRAPTPLLLLSRGLLGSLSLAADVGRDLLQVWGGRPSWGSASLLRQQLSTLWKGLDPRNPETSLNAVNLKQFRDAGTPESICYQALTSSRMKVTRFGGAGLLGELPQTTGDPSGGLEVRIHRSATQPIIDSLGLVVSRWEDTRQAHGSEQGFVTDGPASNTYLRELGGAYSFDPSTVGSVATLKPVFPYWLEVDFSYGVGEALAWRTKSSPWIAAGGRLGSPEGEGETEPRPESAEPCPYLTTNSVGLLAAGGPYLFSGATARVLPLLADPARLQAFCDQNLNLEHGLRFEPFGRYVFLVIWSFGEMSSAVNNVGRWIDHEVTISVPVRLRRAGQDRGQLLSLAMVSPYVFTNSSIATNNYREVLGIPARKAQIHSPEDVWLAEEGPTRDRRLLHLRANVFPALQADQRFEKRTLLEVVEGEVLPLGDDSESGPWRLVANYWGRRMRRELERKVAAKTRAGQAFRDLKALSLEILANRGSLSYVNLKQFRDSEEPSRACYQEVLLSPVVFDQVYQLEEIDRPLSLRIHRYPDMPIVETLGLELKNREMSKSSLPGRVWEGAVVETVQPVRPFWLKVDLRTLPAHGLRHRAPGLEWHGELPKDPYFAGGRPAGVGEGLLEHLADPEHPERRKDLRAAVERWHDLESSERMSVEDARRAVTDEDLEPQMAIESLLGDGWGSLRDEVPERPDFLLRWDSLGRRYADQHFPAPWRIGPWYYGESQAPKKKRKRKKPEAEA